MSAPSMAARLSLSLRRLHVCVYTFAVGLFCVTTLGFGDAREDSRGVRVAVDGSVTLNGELLPAGRIIFITDQGDGQVKAAAEIVNGWYSFTDQNGPLKGEARVEIHPVGLELEQFEATRDGNVRKRIDVTPMDIPTKYNVRSKLTATISADSTENYVNFELATRQASKK
ncbi:hypothetical protein [Fuerstiella marisgermanici]|uniref:Carboxypeptidase regulatory-like domain-containing protein n=1 Tax=Fuerstiella marisgermanici TaxID=1891926 RepID=A0A1P8WR21_9PLAN|nr:hypothetical protein [Fuerstiella marisgermanici]APZ96510.1 hypothetical protein Fuma_06179 [Fuerstiella marisgermanici]